MEINFNFDECMSSEEVYNMFKKNIKQISEHNLPLTLKKYSNIPFVKNISFLIKY